jgi:hypothetical protein
VPFAPVRCQSAPYHCRASCGLPHSHAARRMYAPVGRRVDEDSWEYERGRQWAIAAPTTMPLKIGRRVNSDAICLQRE